MDEKKVNRKKRAKCMLLVVALFFIGLIGYSILRLNPLGREGESQIDKFEVPSPFIDKKNEGIAANIQITLPSITSSHEPNITITGYRYYLPLIEEEEFYSPKLPVPSHICIKKITLLNAIYEEAPHPFFGGNTSGWSVPNQIRYDDLLLSGRAELPCFELDYTGEIDTLNSRGTYLAQIDNEKPSFGFPLPSQSVQFTYPFEYLTYSFNIELEFILIERDTSKQREETLLVEINQAEFIHDNDWAVTMEVQTLPSYLIENEEIEGEDHPYLEIRRLFFSPMFRISRPINVRISFIFITIALGLFLVLVYSNPKITIIIEGGIALFLGLIGYKSYVLPRDTKLFTIVDLIQIFYLGLFIWILIDFFLREYFPGAKAKIRRFFNRRAASPLNINEATAEELAELPVIGDVLAKRIVERRENVGPITTLEDLIGIRGISETGAEKLRPLITLE